MTSSTTQTSTTETQAWVAPFIKILELEDANGFVDKAVVGGLDRFLQRWAESMGSFLAKNDGKDDLIQELVHNRYGDMSPAQRAQWAARWLSRRCPKGSFHGFLSHFRPYRMIRYN